MGICWYCHWGWSREVADIYQRAEREIDALDMCPPANGEHELHFGPAHIVWEDENFGRDSVQWCLENFDKHRRDMPDAVAVIVRRSLEEMLALPDHIRDPEPEDYDDENPERYPPAVAMVAPGDI